MTDEIDGPPCLSGCGCTPWAIEDDCTCPGCGELRDYWNGLPAATAEAAKRRWAAEWLAGSVIEEVAAEMAERRARTN